MGQKGSGKAKKTGRILALAAGALLAAAGIATGIFVYEVVVGASYRTDDIADYGEFEGYEGYSYLLTFPDAIPENAEPEQYIYRYGDRLFDPECQIFLECTYGEADFQKELERLERLRNLEYDTENFKYPAYVKTNGREHCYEYALVLDEDTIAYVYLQYMRRDEIRFSWDYLPEAYELKEMKGR